MAIKVLVVEGKQLVRLGIRAALAEVEDIRITAEASESAEGLEKYKEADPDVVILSLRLPDSCAVDDIEKYFKVDPGAKIIVLAEHSGDAEIRRSIDKGALGYVPQDVSPAELARAVKIVAAGSRFIPDEIASIISENLGSEDLTAAERRILEMLVDGMSNKEIGRALGVSENTVKTHVKNVFGKLGVADRTSAVTAAIKRGLVRMDI